MNILKAFDEALVREETKSGAVRNNYLADGNPKPYASYLDNGSWDAFLEGMDDKHREEYGAGGGKELEEKDGKPPKMASFASSSRMIYNLSKHIPDFAFEKKLTTTVGGMANLDGYLKLEDKVIFVEAKCREPYSHKAEQIIKQNYRDVYAYLQEKMPDNFSCIMENILETKEENPKRNMRVAFFCKGKSVAYFDIKQMICHLLAVATEALKHPVNKKLVFLYLLYDPSDLQMPQEAKNEIMRIYGDTCWAANNYDFKAMFGHIVDFLLEKNKFDENAVDAKALKSAFSFMLCDQKIYKEQLR